MNQILKEEASFIEAQSANPSKISNLPVTYEVRYDITKNGDFIQTYVPTFHVPMFNQILNNDKKPGDDA